MARVSEVGGMKGFAGVYMHRPDLFKAFMFNYGIIWSHGLLEPVLKDLVRLKSSHLNGCRY